MPGMSTSEEHLARCEKELAETALKNRATLHGLHSFRKVVFGQRTKRYSNEINYEDYGLIPLHRNVEAWMYVSEDPQLSIAIEEIVNSFSPALSVELLLYNVLGSNSESATCLVKYLITHYASNQQCEHIKTTLRNMIRWTVLAGFVPCVFLNWKKLRALGLGLSGKAFVTNLVSHTPSVHRDTYDQSKRRRIMRNGTHEQHEPCFSEVADGLSPPDAAFEAVQERDAQEEALSSVLDVPLEHLADTLKVLMSKWAPKTQASVVCKIIRDWVERDVALKRDPIKETELKIAIVAMWGVMKTFECGRCPVIPECRASGCVAFYDTETDLVTVTVDGVLYQRISMWDGCSDAGSNLSSLAKRAHLMVRSLKDLERFA